MYILVGITALLTCHRTLSFPLSLDDSNFNAEDYLKKVGIVKNNNYFQGSEQIFNAYNITINASNSNIICKNKNQTVKIPDDYILAPGIGAHKVLTSKKNWNQARNHCITEGAHLADIRSSEEEAAIKKLLANQEIEEAWLGLHETFQKNDWVTVFDQPLKSLQYVNWRQGEPNNLGGNEQCGSYYINGMNDLACEKERAFICKIIV